MAGEAATVTYLIAEPFQQALRSLQMALTARHLSVAGTFDISAHLRRKLFIGTYPCMVLFVSPSRLPGTALDTDGRAAALAPFHIVVSNRGRQTEIHVLRALPRDCGSLEAPCIAALNEAHTEILRAIETIGMPAAMGV